MHSPFSSFPAPYCDRYARRTLRLDTDPLSLLDIFAHLCLDIIHIIDTDDLVPLPSRFEVLHSCHIVPHGLTFLVQCFAEVLTQRDELWAEGPGRSDLRSVCAEQEVEESGYKDNVSVLLVSNSPQMGSTGEG